MNSIEQLLRDQEAEIERLRERLATATELNAAYCDLEKRQDAEIARLRQQYVDVCAESDARDAEIERLRERLTITDEKVEAAHQWSGGMSHADVRAALLAAGMVEAKP